MGMSQLQLAEKIGVSQQQISFYENNKDYPSLEVAMRIAGTFGVGIENIFFTSKNNSKL